ncbi:hypothetical protein ACGTNG_02530 [Halomonas sp. 1390]
MAFSVTSKVTPVAAIIPLADTTRAIELREPATRRASTCPGTTCAWSC